MTVQSRITQVEGALLPREIAMLHLEAINKFLSVVVARALKSSSETGQIPEALTAEFTEPESAWLKERFEKIPKKWSEADLIPLLREIRDVSFYKTLALGVNVRCLDIAQGCKNLFDRHLVQMLFLRPLPKLGDAFLGDYPPWRVSLEEKFTWRFVRDRSFACRRGTTKTVGALFLKGFGFASKIWFKAA
jgi:hypothetical protein